jgi:hypothetical protein
VEEQGVLDMARVAMRLQDELCDKLRMEDSGAGGNGDGDEYVHLADTDLDDDFDTDELAYLELPTDEEGAEAAAEQRAPMASFDT